MGWRLLLLIFLVVPFGARAGAIDDFNHRFENAWAQYRDAFYRSAPGHEDRPAAEEALRAFLAAWRGLSHRWATTPPPQYGEDAQFGKELQTITEVAAQAAAELAVGRLPQAHATLSQIRKLLAEMRQRNGLEAYTDRLDAFDEALAEAADDDLDQPELTPTQFVQLCEQVGVLSYLAERMEKGAPTELADDANFYDMVEGIARQVRILKAAVLDGKREAVAAALADLRQSFDKFYLLYG
jgi:hypothetical protein